MDKLVEELAMFFFIHKKLNMTMARAKARDFIKRVREATP